MKRITWIARFLCLVCLLTHGQGLVYGQYISYPGTYLFTFAGGLVSSSGSISPFMSLRSPTKIPRNYSGSAYLTSPMWQEGTVRLTTSDESIPGKVAYNLVTNDVMCQFNEESKTRYLRPHSFTINGLPFTRYVKRILGVNYDIYVTPVYGSRTKLLKNITKELVFPEIDTRQQEDNQSYGYYKTKGNYYLQKGNAEPELVELTKEGLLHALYEQSDKIASFWSENSLTTNGLTINVIAKTLDYYDLLMGNSVKELVKERKAPLSVESVFVQSINKKISYPQKAKTDNVYGRIYVGFDIDELGVIKNITTLSPDNSGYGFDEEVKNNLKKLIGINSVYVGHYVLPVAFTLTNLKGTANLYVPTNTLSADRLDGRTMLNEIVVPAGVSTFATRHEVWGYYK